LSKLAPERWLRLSAWGGASPAKIAASGTRAASLVERLRPQGESRTEVWSSRRCQSWRAPRKDYRADCEGCVVPLQVEHIVRLRVPFFPPSAVIGMRV